MDCREMISRHGHVVALSASVLLFAAAASAALLPSGADREALASAAGNAGRVLESGSGGPVAATKSADPREAWRRPLAAPAGRGEFVFAPRPRIVPRTKESPGGVPKTRVVIGTPVVRVAEVTPGSVRLAWTMPAARAGETAARISGYLVYRSVSAGATPELAGRSVASTYADDSVLPDASYVYSVRAVSSEPAHDGSIEGALSAPVSAVTPGGVELAYTMTSVEVAHVTVRKYVKGEWREKTFNVRKGEEIGKPEKRRAGEIDFTSGFRLVEIRVAAFEEPFIRQVRRIVDGELVVTDVAETRTRDRFQIVVERLKTGDKSKIWIKE